MMVKKRIRIFLSCILAISFLVSGCGNKDNTTGLEANTVSTSGVENETDTNTDSSSLEPLKTKETVYYEHVRVDVNEVYSNEEEEQIEKEVNEKLNSFFSLVFNFNENTEDYTEQILTSYTHLDNVDLVYPTNIYPVFSGVHMDSVFDNFTIGLIHLGGTTDHPVAYVKGSATVDYKSDRIERGKRDIDCTISLERDGEDWTIFELNIAGVVDVGSIRYWYDDDATKAVINTSSMTPIIERWDFADPEGFLSDYTYGYTEEDLESIPEIDGGNFSAN